MIFVVSPASSQAFVQEFLETLRPKKMFSTQKQTHIIRRSKFTSLRDFREGKIVFNNGREQSEVILLHIYIYIYILLDSLLYINVYRRVIFFSCRVFSITSKIFFVQILINTKRYSIFNVVIFQHESTYVIDRIIKMAALLHTTIADLLF